MKSSSAPRFWQARVFVSAFAICVLTILACDLSLDSAAQQTVDQAGTAIADGAATAAATAVEGVLEQIGDTLSTTVAPLTNDQPQPPGTRPSLPQAIGGIVNRYAHLLRSTTGDTEIPGSLGKTIDVLDYYLTRPPYTSGMTDDMLSVMNINSLKLARIGMLWDVLELIPESTFCFQDMRSRGLFGGMQGRECTQTGLTLASLGLGGLALLGVTSGWLVVGGVAVFGLKLLVDRFVQ